MTLRPLGRDSPYCHAKPCPDYAEAVELVRRLAAPGGGPGCLSASVGRCGWGFFRYVVYSDGFGGYEEFFDREGRLMGAYTYADYDQKGSTFGEVPACTRAPMSILCDQGSRGASAFDAAFTTPRSPADVTATQASSALGFALPARATGYRTHSSGLQATMRQLRFELPKADLPTLEKTLPCALGPESKGPVERTVVGTNTEPWWTPEKSTRHRECRTRVGIHASAVLVDLAERDQASVYVLVTDD
jgi:hypothetical protein